MFLKMETSGYHNLDNKAFNYHEREKKNGEDICTVLPSHKNAPVNIG
jgi:hypothetical protein